MVEPVLKRKLVSLSEAAAMLGRSVPATRQLVYSGAFEVFRLGPRSKIWIPVQEIDRFVAEHTMQRTPPRSSGAGIARGRGAKAAAR